jgi:glyoxylase I family protein
MPAVQRVSHVTFSVTDSMRSAEFYAKLLEGQVMDASDDVSPFHVCVAGDVILGFRAHAGTASGEAFDHLRIGLDHLALGVEGTGELEKWSTHLNELGVKHSGIQQDASGSHLNARDPDNIAIEFFVAGS